MSSVFFVPHQPFTITHIAKLLNHIIVDDSIFHILAHDVPCIYGVFMTTLPYPMLCFINISLVVIKGQVISFHSNGPQCHPSKKQPHSRDLAQR